MFPTASMRDRELRGISHAFDEVGNRPLLVVRIAGRTEGENGKSVLFRGKVLTIFGGCDFYLTIEVEKSDEGAGGAPAKARLRRARQRVLGHARGHSEEPGGRHAS